MKHLLKRLTSHVGIGTYQRLLAHSIQKHAFQELESAPAFENREKLWDNCIVNYVGANTKLTYVEFGVHRGHSIKYFASKNLHKESRFIGLDSFEGLPEDWGKMPKGSFDTQGNVPKTEDGRISFIKGWFQDTWDQLNSQISDAENLVVHYDADLYSSTLFALSKIDSIKQNYIAIFDEFQGDEARALYNYIQSYNATIKFVGKTVFIGLPAQVTCTISPHRHSIAA